MTLIKDIVTHLERIAPLQLQENYDNSGFLIGNIDEKVNNILVCLDCTEAVIDEAIKKQCNLIISHHPIIFKGLKKITGSNYIEKTILKAIQNGISIYAIHTNLDNVLQNGVNSKIAEKLMLKNLKVLRNAPSQLAKLITFVPNEYADKVREALFAAGAGKIGNYDSCSFNTEGKGTFKANENANPFKGEINKLHFENEIKIETVFPVFLKNKIISALQSAHPYEEVAYDIFMMLNTSNYVGSGIVGEFQNSLKVTEFLNLLKRNMNLDVIKYTQFDKEIKKVAICGGSGSFLLEDAKSAGADAFVTSDFKYHEFFDGENNILICDIGHYESEQFTKELIIEIIKNKFPNFAPVLTETKTNPVKYFY
ncbi:MAG: Nif3-like dinuclear metal center hexameric protein [Bacteroidetes bacterium]|nr:Nif3-like dinuclear metal center hexameric protein [Bacteroidota bacterium]